MARTVRKPIRKFWRKEATGFRRASVRRHRKAANAATRAGRELPSFKGTGGRLTW
jgi:hypothetical protein